VIDTQILFIISYLFSKLYMMCVTSLYKRCQSYIISGVVIGGRPKAPMKHRYSSD